MVDQGTTSPLGTVSQSPVNIVDLCFCCLFKKLFSVFFLLGFMLQANDLLNIGTMSQSPVNIVPTKFNQSQFLVATI